MIMIKKLLTALSLILLTACAPMHLSPDHPSLPYSVTRIPDNEVYAKCARTFSDWKHILLFPNLPLGCAERLPQHCIIWVGYNSPDWVIEHEIMHCSGYIHN